MLKSYKYQVSGRDDQADNFFTPKSKDLHETFVEYRSTSGECRNCLTEQTKGYFKRQTAIQGEGAGDDFKAQTQRARVDWSCGNGGDALYLRQMRSSRLSANQCDLERVFSCHLMNHGANL